MSRLLIASLCALSLAGCGEGRAIADNPAKHLYQIAGIYLAADVVSLMSTGKTVDDHVVGMATGQDCSTLRLSHGGPWCIPYPAPVAMVAVTEYCYKSLASASCYTTPLPVDQNGFTGSRTDEIPAP